jgi:hypothetical protein
MRFRAFQSSLVFLLVLGIDIGFGSKSLDNILAVLILGLYLVGSAVLVLRTLLAPRQNWRQMASCGELSLLPEKWRRWALDEPVVWNSVGESAAGSREARN